MVYNNGFTTAYVLRGCPNGFVVGQSCLPLPGLGFQKMEMFDTVYLMVYMDHQGIE